MGIGTDVEDLQFSVILEGTYVALNRLGKQLVPGYDDGYSCTVNMSTLKCYMCIDWKQSLCASLK